MIDQERNVAIQVDPCSESDGYIWMLIKDETIIDQGYANTRFEGVRAGRQAYAKSMPVQLPPGLQPVMLTQEEAAIVRRVYDDQSQETFSWADLPKGDASSIKRSTVDQPPAPPTKQ